jgi:hypothetical protein
MLAINNLQYGEVLESPLIRPASMAIIFAVLRAVDKGV